MKTYNYWDRKALILMATCLFLSGYAVNQAISSEAQPGPAAVAKPASTPVSGAARLIIHRIADLGRNVIVKLSIDDAPPAFIAYGHTYEAVLPSGRHVLSVAATPNAKWKTPSEMTLDVQKGQTYNFTAMDDGSGHLILKRE